MSLDFIKSRTGSNKIILARRQQDQLSYFTQSSIQEEINLEYITKWVNRKYVGEDKFLNWVKAVFRTKNAMAFYKYLRFPVASSDLVNNKLKDQLARVFFAEDSFFNYKINGMPVDTPENLNVKEFNKLIFQALLFHHNDVVFHDLRDINTPFRHIVSINNVVAIKSVNSVIKQICFVASVVIDNILIKGFLFADAERYMFFEDKDGKMNETPILDVPHDLGQCPADYISADPFNTDNDIVRKSVFSYVRPLMEEYCFLKTLQKMTEPNGVIPVTTELKAKIAKRDGVDTDGPQGHPMSAREIGSQRSEFPSEVLGANNSGSIAQAGARIKINPEDVRKADGSLDMEAVKNYINFHHLPVEPMRYLDERINDIEKSIVVSIVGGIEEQREQAKNREQVIKGLNNQKDKLRGISRQLTRIRNRSDFKFLALEFGPDNVDVNCFYGSDFFIESQEEIYSLIEKAPNPIEQRELLKRASQNRNKFNQSNGLSETIMYDLLPFVNEKDFDRAITKGIDDTLFQYQNRFNYWIGIFEAEHGDLAFFWTSVLDGTDSEKLNTINKLILNIIQNEQINSSTSTGVP